MGNDIAGVPPTTRSAARGAGWVLIAGLGIGWLGGLSISPVVSAILASLLGLAAGAVTALQATKTPTEGAVASFGGVDPRPMALLILGVAIGAPLGIVARTHHWFGPGPPAAPDTTAAGAPAGGATASAGVAALFSSSPSACDEFLAVEFEQESVIRREFRRLFPGARGLDTLVTDPARLVRFARVACDRP